VIVTIDIWGLNFYKSAAELVYKIFIPPRKLLFSAYDSGGMKSFSILIRDLVYCFIMLGLADLPPRLLSIEVSSRIWL